MPFFECYAREAIIEAETAEDAKLIFSELVWSEPESVTAYEVEESEDEINAPKEMK